MRERVVYDKVVCDKVVCVKECVAKWCVTKLCVKELCVTKLCVTKLCVTKLSVTKLCVTKLCVYHLHRCKTSFDCSEFSTLCLQGGSARLTDTAQRRHCQFVVIQSLISSAYLHQFFISLNGNRLSQVPACRLVSNFYYGLCYI